MLFLRQFKTTRHEKADKKCSASSWRLWRRRADNK